jgi:hypothetical protein
VTDELGQGDTERNLDELAAVSLDDLGDLSDEQIRQALPGLDQPTLALRRMEIQRLEGKTGPEVELTEAEYRVQLKETLQALRDLGDRVTVTIGEPDGSVTTL